MNICHASLIGMTCILNTNHMVTWRVGTWSTIGFDLRAVWRSRGKLVSVSDGILKMEIDQKIKFWIGNDIGAHREKIHRRGRGEEENCRGQNTRMWSSQICNYCA